MRLTVAWHPAALHALYTLHWQTAAAIDAVVIRFAETGEGELERIPPRYRLRAGRYDVICNIDSAAREMTVFWLYKAR